MERFNEWFINNIESSLIYGLNKLNYLVYRMEWSIIILGFAIAVILIIYNRKKYSYRYELSRLLKISLFIVLTSYLIKTLNVKVISAIFDGIFYNLMPVTFLCIIIGYLLDKIIFYKCNNNLKTEIRYFKYIIGVTYTFLLISATYQIKDILLPSIWQIILISIKFLMENKQNKPEKSECILYETRKKQLGILEDIIKKFEYENYAISINGEWGSGKSELISALIENCSKNNSYYVYIEPMISDTQESLIKEFQIAVSKLMQDNGICSGRNSSLNKYFKEILKLIQFNNKVTLADFIETTSNDNSYKDLKKELQEDINLLLDKGSKKLIVVIDDFDRVDEDKQLDILSFIKEVIDFKGCVTIIALDYENLRDNKVVTPVYLEKFIATQIPLVDMEFDELIKFHAKDILNENLLQNNFAKKILLKVNTNINNYHNNIVKRIYSYCEGENDRIYKSKDNEDNKKKDIKELEKLIKFAKEREKYIDNSRRVKHFLNEIQSTIILIDKLYNDRVDGEELLKRIKVSEIIYFFNYIKVFYKEAYESIVKSKGISEYLRGLDTKNMGLQKKYFEIVLKDIIPTNINIYGIINDERKELNGTNSLNLIKDLFIDYHFTKNNIELLTNSEKILNEIDNNCISINEDFLENIKVYQRAIFKHSKSEEEITKRIKSLVKYAITLYKQEKIDFSNLLEISSYRNSYTDMVYVKYYLQEAFKLVNDGKADKIYEKDKARIDSILRDLEMDNIAQYRYVFIELLVIWTLDKNNNVDIDELLKDIRKNNELFKKIKKYSINNGLIKENDNIVDLKELLELLFKKIKIGKYTVIDLELLNKRLKEFLLNYKYIGELKKIKINIDSIDKYEELSHYPNINNINQAKKILKGLAQEEVINSHMMSCFQQIIKIIIRESAADDECKSNIMIVFKKLKKEDVWNEYEWFNIMVNVERVLKLNKDIK